MNALTIPADVQHVLPLLLALSTPAVLWTKYFVQLTKTPFDRIKADPAHSNAVRLYTLGVGALSLLALAIFFGEPVSAATWRALAVTAAVGAADGGAAMADYHLMDVLRSLLPLTGSSTTITPPPASPPAP